MTRFWSGVNGMIERGAIDSGAGPIGGGTLPVGVNGGYSLAVPPIQKHGPPLGVARDETETKI